jgi:hypothetical protein
MSFRIRFSTARSVFEAFPDLRRVVALPPEEFSSLDYARVLMGSASPVDAVIFVAHVLPRREAVWWAIQCVQTMLGDSAKDDAFLAAEAWLSAPMDDTRRAALAAYSGGDHRSSTTWLAFAAGWSGGSVTPPDQEPMLAPPAACALGVHTSIILAACVGDPLSIVDRVKACADVGIRFIISGGEANARA